jgi:hypothetical protein
MRLWAKEKRRHAQRLQRERKLDEAILAYSHAIEMEPDHVIYIYIYRFIYRSIFMYIYIYIYAQHVVRVDLCPNKR